MTFIGLFFLMIVLLSFLYIRGELHLDGSEIDYKAFPIFLIIIILTPLSVYFLSKRNYNSARGLKDPIVYTFTESGVYAKGENFESALAWSLYYKIVETKRYFILYQNNMVLNLVPKAAFKSQEQIRELRSLIASQASLKQKLRKN